MGRLVEEDDEAPPPPRFGGSMGGGRNSDKTEREQRLNFTKNHSVMF